MQLRKTKRVISALMAIVMIVPALGARDASCFCSSCDSDSSCCSAKSCCDSESSTSKPCRCCPADDVSTQFTRASEAVVPQGCQCISSAPTEVAPITRMVQLDHEDWVAVLPEQTTIALHDGPAVRDVELANLFATSRPPLRILYCSWLE